MATIYVSKQGDMVDLICWRHYGRSREVTETVLAANPGLAEKGPILPFGTRLVLPAIERRSTLRLLVSLTD